MGSGFTSFAGLLTGAGIAIFTVVILLGVISHVFEIRTDRSYGWLLTCGVLGAVFVAAGQIAAMFA